jgi:hypothetical protein
LTNRCTNNAGLVAVEMRQRLARDGWSDGLYAGVLLTGSDVGQAGRKGSYVRHIDRGKCDLARR